jgi:hypothetical protein
VLTYRSGIAQPASGADCFAAAARAATRAWSAANAAAASGRGDAAAVADGAVADGAEAGGGVAGGGTADGALETAGAGAGTAATAA